MLRPPFHSARLKIEWADQKIGDLLMEIGSFLRREPYKAIRHEKSEPEGWVEWRAEVREQPPSQIGLIVGDIIHNLRSSLDHIVWELVERGGARLTESERRKLGFPIYDCSEKFEAELQRKVKGASQAAVDFIKNTKPYKGGNEPLWWLDELDVRDKHRVLLAVGSAVTLNEVHVVWDHPAVKPHTVAPFGDTDFGKPIYPLVDGTKLCAMGPAIRPDGAKVYVNAEFSFDVAFGEPGVAEGEPILPTVHNLMQVTKGLFRSFLAII